MRDEISDDVRTGLGLRSNAELKRDKTTAAWTNAFWLYLLVSIALTFYGWHTALVTRQALLACVFVLGAAYALAARFKGMNSDYHVRKLVSGIWLVPVVSAGFLLLDI